jgi:hypothetical protein
MRPENRAVWVAFSEPLEGMVYSIYADVKSLPTTGMGNLLPTPQSATLLPFRRPDGSLATATQKAAEWTHVRHGCCLSYPTCGWPSLTDPRTGRPCFAHKGWKASELHLGALNGLGGPLKLRRADVDALIFQKVDQFYGILCKYFPELPSWPVKAELAVMSMAWALGPHFPRTWPKFSEAARAQDFDACGVHCLIRGAGTIVQRNAKNAALFAAAANEMRAAVVLADEPIEVVIEAIEEAPQETTEVVEDTEREPEAVKVDVSDQAPVPASGLAAFLAWLVGWFVTRFGRL